MPTSELRAGAMAIVPMLIGVVPFGLVAGVTAVAGGLGIGAAVGFSTIVFAGASQLAAIDVLSGGGAALVAALAACTINLRMLLYSASLAPYYAEETFARRMAIAYLMTDQAYAVSITRFAGERTDRTDPGTRSRRFAYYLGAGLTLWSAWQLSTVAGALVGNAVPSSVPLTFAVPLVFLVLLVPTLSARHAVVAAVVGGLSTVVALEAGVGPLSVMLGALAGIAAGASVDRDEPEPAALA
jgi:predicted branched-subunit amino acid permease